MERERKNSSTTIKKNKQKENSSLALKEKFCMRYIAKLRELNIPHFQHEATRRIFAPLDGMSGVTVYYLDSHLRNFAENLRTIWWRKEFQMKPVKTLPLLRKIGKGRLFRQAIIK